LLENNDALEKKFHGTRRTGMEGTSLGSPLEEVK